MNGLIRYQGRPAALVSSLRVHFLPPFNERPPSDPDRRFVFAMAIGYRDGARTQEELETYASALLEEDEAPGRESPGGS